jgi:hypothetical protein
LLAFFVGNDRVAEFHSFKAITDAITADLKKQYREVMPKASIVALNKTSNIARDAVKVDMKRIFKSPTPYALNASRSMFANKATLSAAVLLKDTGNGTPAERYLGPEIEGGTRELKNFEKSLQAKGILPAGMFVVPGNAAIIDRFGNQSSAQIVEVLAAMSAYKSGGKVAKAVTRRALARRPRAMAKYFVHLGARSGDGSGPPGIYKVVSSGHVAPVMLFVHSPHYSARFPFYPLAKAHGQAALPAALDEALGVVGGNK